MRQDENLREKMRSLHPFQTSFPAICIPHLHPEHPEKIFLWAGPPVTHTSSAPGVGMGLVGVRNSPRSVRCSGSDGWTQDRSSDLPPSPLRPVDQDYPTGHSRQEEQAQMQSKPPNLDPAGASVSPCVKEIKAGLVQAPLLRHNLMLPGQHPRGPAWRAPARTDPQGVNARGTSGPGAHTCVRSRSNPGSRANTRPRLRRAQVQQAPGARSWGPASAGRGGLTCA